MHILSQLNIKVHPVLIDAAMDHFSLTRKKIMGFKLPVWMYEKLKREPGFVPVATGEVWGKYLGYKVIKSSDPTPRMYEEGSIFEFNVFENEEV